MSLKHLGYVYKLPFLLISGDKMKMKILDKLVIFLMANVKVKVATIASVCNYLDRDEDNCVSLGEMIYGVLNVIRK